MIKKMRKFQLFSLLTVLAIFITLAVSCKDEDNIAPKITLKADSDGNIETVYVTLNDVWVDPGFSADDNKDKIIDSINIVVELSKPDMMDEEGEYVITYTVSDDAGNKTSVERNVIVRNAMYPFKGTYSVLRTEVINGSKRQYEQTISQHKSKNNVITFSKFSGIDDPESDKIMSLKVNAEVTLDHLNFRLDTDNDKNEKEDWIKTGDDIYWFKNGVEGLDNFTGVIDSVSNNVPRFTITYTYKKSDAGAEQRITEVFSKKVN